VRQPAPPDRLAWLAVPGLGYLGLIFAVPLVLLLAKSFVDRSGAFSVAAYVEFFSEPYNLTVLWRTIRVALLTTLLAFVIAYPTAFALAGRAAPCRP